MHLLQLVLVVHYAQLLPQGMQVYDEAFAKVVVGQAE